MSTRIKDIYSTLGKSLENLSVKKTLLRSLFERFKEGGFEVKYWDGEVERYGSQEPSVRIVFNNPLPTDFDLEDPALSFGEAYMDEVFDIEGDLEEVFKIIEMNMENVFVENGSGIGCKMFSAAKALNSAKNNLQHKENIGHHYDLGNDFFSLWLDETMNYSCAYFKTPQDSLKDAQIQKIDHILKKLHLNPGEKLLDIGSGWGWLILRAAQHYDVEAYGITLSEEQYQATKERAKKLGLEDKVKVELLNYLDLDEDKYQFDKIVSVGMFEHVGKENLPRYMEKVERLLKKEGLSMLHTITKPWEGPVNTWMQKYIFPGGYVPSLREIMWMLPNYDFHLIHVESLRMHYAMTLDRWHENFSRQKEEVEEMFDRRFVRMWELYLRCCAASFKESGLNIHQILFSKGLNNDLPLTLEHIYIE